VIGSVAGQSAIVVRIIEVPKMTDAELKETMKWEVERHVPFAPSETIMDYQPLPPMGPDSETNPNMEVLLAVAQQDIIANYVDTMFAAGLDPIAIDIEPLAVGRSLLDIVEGRAVSRPQAMPGRHAAEDSGGPGADPEIVAVVNIGASNTDISIYQEGQLVFPRSLPLAGDSLTRAVSEILNYPLDQSERYKRDLGEVQLEKMSVYTGTAYGEEGAYDPQFSEEGAFLGEHEDIPLRNPFDTSPDPADTFGDNPFLTKETPQFDDIERTQPIRKRILDLAGRPNAEPGAGFGAQPDADSYLGMPGGPTNVNEAQVRNQVFEAIAPILGELATELRRSLDYYRSRAQGRSVDRVLLVGGSASLKNLGPFLQSELQVPVSVGNPLASLVVAARNRDQAYIDSLGAAFAVALGLAVRNAVSDANPAPKAAKSVQMPKIKGTKGTPSAPSYSTNPPVS
jgi:type IV pilus assembly protein PilM